MAEQVGDQGGGRRIAMRAMAAAAVAQAAAGAYGLTFDALGAIFSIGFAGLWLLAAASFRKAAREQTSAGAAP